MILSGHKLRFLVVADSEDDRALLVSVAENLGGHADPVCDGVQAVEALAVRKYHYVLLDLALPRMPGEDVMRWVKDHRQWAGDLRVVVVSGIARHHRERLQELGAHAVIEKPLCIQELRDLIREPRIGQEPGLRMPA